MSRKIILKCPNCLARCNYYCMVCAGTGEIAL